MTAAVETVPVLRVRDACKRFGAVVALDGVTFDVAAGEVLALLGDNGAGKSTLIKAISGVHRLDSGSVTLDGVDITSATAMAVRAHGVETVYQDLALFDNLDPAANFFAGRELARPTWLPHGLRLMRHRQMAERTAELLDRLQVKLPDLDAAVALMSGGQRQAVAVARAVAFSSRLVILDEPTAALGLRESSRVLDLVRRLKDDGVTVILISHSMDHVMAVADRALVLRRGRTVGQTAPTAENHGQLVSWIVGATDGRAV
ncbi:MAG TPA: ATP-binding cassette domain-containing protein [Kineosporiaceae bacterium]|nr:ATP-binding cassette domain-containing protein [Kineosporiaceae bacterium]